MADADDTKHQEDAEEQQDTEEQQDSKTGKSDKTVSGGGILPWIIMVVVIAACGGSGSILGRFFAGSRTPETAGASEQDQSVQVEDLTVAGLAAGSQKTWYYHLAPVVANLDVPEATRYIRVSLTLDISSEVDEKKGAAFIDERIPILTSWLTVYLSSLSLEDVRGDKNLKRIQSQVLDTFNEKLFPDSKPQIKHVLFKEFAVQ